MLGREYYQHFSDSSKKWMPYLYIERDRKAPEWFSFIRYLSQSVLAFYSFHTKLKEKVYQGREDSVLPRRIYNFYADLIMSKLKKAIFTENPRNSIQDVSALGFNDFKDIFDYISSQKDAKNITDYELYYFYLKAFCYFDIVFLGSKPVGFFSRYQPIRKVRNEFCGHLEKLNTLLKTVADVVKKTKRVDVYTSLNELQLEILLLPVKNLTDSVNYFHPGYPIDYDVAYQRVFPPDFEPDTFAFDPLSRFYSYIIWKCLKVLKSSFKYVDSTNNYRFIAKFLEKFENYLTTLVNLLKHSKTSELDNLMALLVKNDYEFVEEFLLNQMLNYSRHGGLNSISYNAGYQLKAYPHKENSDRLKDIAINFIYDPHDLNEIRGPWKFENLILNAPIEDIQFLIERIAATIPSKWGDKPIIGVLRSGSFTSYLYNVVTGYRGRIMHFKSTPYISIVPGSVELPQSGNIMEVLIFDESYKSGFTYEILKEYIYRKKEIKEFNACFFSLAKVIDYNPAQIPKDMFFIYSWTYQGMQTMSRDLMYISGHYIGDKNENNFYRISDYLNQVSISEDALKENVEAMIKIGSQGGAYDR